MSLIPLEDFQDMEIQALFHLSLIIQLLVRQFQLLHQQVKRLPQMRL